MVVENTYIFSFFFLEGGGGVVLLNIQFHSIQVFFLLTVLSTLYKDFFPKHAQLSFSKPKKLNFY